MALRRKTSNPNIGVKPTQSQKLAYIADKLKLTGIKEMQGSTVNITDTVLLGSNAAGRTTLSFFSQSNGKSRNFSNFQNGTLSAGEAMVIENISFFLLSLSAASLTADSTTITSIRPLTQIPNALISLKEAFQLGLLNITIANSKVVKDYNVFEQNPSFNPKTTGISLGGLLQASDDVLNLVEETIGQNTITLESPPVLPPNQKLEVTLEVPPIGTVTGNMAIMCVLGRFGSIFSAKTTL